MHNKKMHCIGDNLHTRTAVRTTAIDRASDNSHLHLKVPPAAEVFGQLVVLGFDVTVFTPAPYQRHRL